MYTYRDSPHGNGVGYNERVFEISHEFGTDVAMKGLDEVEATINGSKEQQNKPILHMQSC